MHNLLSKFLENLLGYFYKALRLAWPPARSVVRSHMRTKGSACSTACNYVDELMSMVSAAHTAAVQLKATLFDGH